MSWATALTPWPTLETERILLRKLQVDDAPDMFEYASDPLVTRYVLIDTHRSQDETRAFLERVVSRDPDSGLATFAVVLKETGKMIGTCGIYLDHERRARAEVAYMLNRAHWGHGYITEALQAVIDFGFSHLGMNRIFARCRPENVASARVMEKVGMTYEGLLREHILVRGEFWDLQEYAILRKEWPHSKLEK